MKRALIVQGGWTGHFPVEIAEILRAALTEDGFDVTVSDTLDAFRDPALPELDLIVPIWTMGRIDNEQLQPLLAAVHGGTGIGGVHGGMCDAFRDATDYQHMTGGQWVAHPGGADVTYSVHITQPGHPICRGVADFELTSEQYYLHVDPSNNVLATTVFASEGGVVMPAVWTRHWGAGRVFYCSVGHVPDDVEHPMVLRLVRQGLAWAANGKTAQ